MQNYYKWLPFGVIGLTAMLLANSLVGEKTPQPSISSLPYIEASQSNSLSLGMLKTSGSIHSVLLNATKDSGRENSTVNSSKSGSSVANKKVVPSPKDIERVASIRKRVQIAQVQRVVVKPVASRGGTTRVQRLIDAGLSLRGIPYKWGGTTRDGFDCSGFVRYVFQATGISLPRTSFAMYGVGVPVSRNELQPGDLVFFATYTKGPSDVRIYIGGGRTIGSSSDGVAIHSLSESYWNKHYLGARRVLNRS